MKEMDPVGEGGGAPAAPPGSASDNRFTYLQFWTVKIPTRIMRMKNN